MKNHVATALALALVAGVTGLSAVPFAAAGHSNCHQDFLIADSQATASIRTLDPGEREIGREDVASGVPETVEFVLLSANDEMVVKVFKDDGSSCTDVTSSACGSSSVVLKSLNERGSCDLAAPEDLEYYVHYKNNQTTDALEYQTWSELA